MGLGMCCSPNTCPVIWEIDSVCLSLRLPAHLFEFCVVKGDEFHHTVPNGVPNSSDIYLFSPFSLQQFLKFNDFPFPVFIVYSICGNFLFPSHVSLGAILKQIISLGQ